MNEVNPEQKTSAIKTLAIIGFITALALGVWLAVQAVRYAPEGFRTLASLAEVVYGKDARFVVTPEKNIVNTGESFRINWTTMRREGTYTFRYTCTDGITAEVRDMGGNLTEAVCESDTALSPESGETEIVFTSNQKRFTDVPFTVTYTPSVNMEAEEEQTAMVTVVNVALADDRLANADDTEDTADTTEEPEGEVASAEDTQEPANPAPTAPKPTPTISKPVVTTAIPVSNPNGYTDLAVRFIAIGSFNSDTERFTPRTSLDTDMHGALQFEVKNVGTKTSSNWTYHVSLPGEDTDSYTSLSQLPLKPNERAVITIAFGDVTQDTGTDRIRVEVRGGSDTTSSNNSFSQSVKITD